MTNMSDLGVITQNCQNMTWLLFAVYRRYVSFVIERNSSVYLLSLLPVSTFFTVWQYRIFTWRATKLQLHLAVFASVKSSRHVISNGVRNIKQNVKFQHKATAFRDEGMSSSVEITTDHGSVGYSNGEPSELISLPRIFSAKRICFVYRLYVRSRVSALWNIVLQKFRSNLAILDTVSSTIQPEILLCAHLVPVCTGVPSYIAGFIILFVYCYMSEIAITLP